MYNLSKLFLIVFLFSGLMINAQSNTDSLIKAKKYQAKAPKTHPFGKEAFQKSKNTTIRWLGMAGFLINSRGTTIMVDPLLEGFDMPLLINFPIKPNEIPYLDAVFVTHADNDHFSVPTNVGMAKVVKSYHSTQYVDSLMKNLNLKSLGHKIGDLVKVKNITARLTPADHAYQNAYSGMSPR
ncbi:MAG: MBL fold metallo-hydrolase [Sediminibacterium sp.]|jgi:L-ascorbate metabolism protein UlaG (beta-lactamase superfamily)|nr:MBL fold metallo-hydrolase [Sediminibacterium sp.]